MRLLLLAVLSTTLLVGCAAIAVPRTLGEQNSGTNYVPTDPLPVLVIPGAGCLSSSSVPRPILEALPDNAVRIAITEVSDSGKIELGASGIGTAGKRYEVILDYINVDTVNLQYRIFAGNAGSPISVFGEVPPGAPIHVERLESAPQTDLDNLINIPVNVGVGLRLTASISVRSGKINLASLGAITAAAEANQVSGSLVLQTLGITGRQVTTALPMPSELNATTVQNAILSMGAIKAMLYDSAGAITTPRVTGFRNSMGRNDTRIINAIISEMARDPIVWSRPCAGSLQRN